MKILFLLPRQGSVSTKSDAQAQACLKALSFALDSVILCEDRSVRERNSAHAQRLSYLLLPPKLSLLVQKTNSGAEPKRTKSQFKAY